MGKISPVSTKYMIYANFLAEGALEKPDVVGALFGQTEGLLGNDLEMRELQKEGKIGRIEVDVNRKDKKTEGRIKIPTALDKSETTLIAAAIETIDRVGPCDTQVDVEKIEDVRGSKRDYIVKRAQEMLKNVSGSTDSREISQTIREGCRADAIQEYGKSKLPAGDLSGKEVIIAEGRADVVNLLKKGINNVIGMNGTRLPDEIKELGKTKELTLFVDGDRGGNLIAQNVHANANLKYIAQAPDGKEVEELNGKSMLMALRKKVSPEEFLKTNKSKNSYSSISNRDEGKPADKIDLSDEDKKNLKKIANEIQNTGKAILLDGNLNEMKQVSSKGLKNSLKKISKKPSVIVIDELVTNSIIQYAEEAGTQAIVAKKFATGQANLKLISA